MYGPLLAKRVLTRDELRHTTDWQIVRLYQGRRPAAETPDDSDDLDTNVARMRALAAAFGKCPDEAEAAVRRAAARHPLPSGGGSAT